MMIEHDPDDIERSLRRLVSRPAPPGLRQRVMAAALASLRNAAWTPRMRAVAAVCSILIIAALVVDPLIQKFDSARMAALLDGSGISTPVEDEGRLLWAEIGGDLGDLDKFRMGGIAISRLGSRGGSGRAYLEARVWTKGMIDHEDPENIY